jgi:hypothetical protein
VRIAHSVVCGFTNLNHSLPFGENSGPSITKNTPKNYCCNVVQAVRWNLLCVSQGARPGSTLCLDETIEHRSSPRMLPKRAICELIVPKTTICKILRKRLRCKPYRFQLVYAWSDCDKEKRQEVCGEMFEKMEQEDFLNNILCSERGFFLSEWLG